MSTRKSTRIAKSPNDNPAANDDDYLSGGGDNSEEESPKKKKTKAGGKRKAVGTHVKSDSVKPPAPKRRRGNRGLLKDVVDMPLDIVYEIFGKLSPGDLFNLSQTSKDLRNILSSKSSASIWKEARGNIPALPDCPSDLSEPQYANLCFMKHCMKCLRPRMTTTYHLWSARIRLCKSCLEQECTNYYPKDTSRIYSVLKYMPSITMLLPGRRQRTQLYYHEPSVLKWHTKLTSRTDKEERLSVERQLKAVHEHGLACSTWLSQRRLEIEEKKASEIDEKGNLVVEYAKKLGWAEEFQLSPVAVEVLKQDNDVHKACTKNLTEKALNNLEETINEVLEGVRVERLSNAVDALLRKRLPLLKEVSQECRKDLSPAQATPSTRQLFELPSVRDLILNTPDTVEMDASYFQPVVDDYAALVGEWRARMDQNLIDLIKEGYGPDRIVDEGTILDLATTVFICSIGCSGGTEPIGYPRALCHACTRRPYGSGKVRKLLTPLEQAENITLRDVLNEGAWNHYSELTFRPELGKMLGDIIELCGFERDTTTRAEMDAANPVFECLACHKGSKGRAVMTWRSTVSHWRKEHALAYLYAGYETETRMKLRVIEDPKEAGLLRRELAVQREKDAACSVSSVCVECHHEGSSADLKTHCKKEHHRTAVDGDILPKIDSGHFCDNYYAWPPRDDDEHALIPGTEIAPIKTPTSKSGAK
ncbi:hypothetical protein D9619_006076 [Psilocybe cf. subviscida]|uniref:F-box domain-containing protein n=1 Tax=Psilocybe cf. subviscida TaxID=2480587 RepID=A0A8H5FBG7_9AGAR|nr:hypothetical protein D9619_006076 [Psilocybe cf. subviscida]